MSIAAMESEIGNQPGDLGRFADRLRKTTITTLDSATTIFTGSGDSYAAAIFARELSKGSTLAEDPYELYMNPSLARNKNIVLISVSGRTRSNVELARRAKGRARKTIAVTANPESPLARTCDSSIILEYRKSERLTSGTSSFTTSLLACAHLIGALPRRLKLESSLTRAGGWAKNILLSKRGLCLFVGSGVDRALAEYGAGKIQEVLGTSAIAQYPEQVGHALLFSLDPFHDRIICINSLGRGKVTQLAGKMSRSGFKVHSISLTGKDVVTKSLAASFYLQYLALFNAEKRGMTEVAFLRNRKRMNLSNRLIY